MLKLKKKSLALKNNNNLFLFLASGVLNDEGFWLIGMKDSELKILDDKTLLECHRKELIGHESAKDILNAIDNQIKFNTNSSHKDFYGDGYSASTIVKKITDFLI